MNESLRINVDPKQITRLMPFKATVDIRYYICGIHVERAPQDVGGVYVMATDGHCLAVIHDKTGSIEGADSAIINISPAAAQACKTAVKKKQMVMSHRLLVRGARLFVAPGFDSEGQANEHFVQPGKCLIEGKFPDWRKIMPDFAKLKRGALTGDCINPRYVGRLGQIDAGNRFGGMATFWQEDPTKVVVCQVTGVPEMLVLIMPARGDSADLQKSLIPYFPFRKEEAPAPAQPSDAVPA